MNVHRHLLAALAAVGLVGTGAALRSGTPAAQATPTAHATASIPTDATIADVAERVVDSVVNISSIHGGHNLQQTDLDPFGDPDESSGPRGLAKGSGVIVTASGRILTNAHVVDGADNIKVTLQDGSELDAKVVGKDTHADLAVLQLKGNVPHNLKPLPFGDSSTLRLGDIVLAVGDGMGIGKSVSMGIVSAKGRANLHIEEYEDFIQTDAAINPGNSGGALVNLKGELVGINTAIASRSGGYQGIGFAIPSNMARPIMDTLVRDGRMTRGFLGVNITTATPELAKDNNLGASTGVVVAGVQPNSPAQAGGLLTGDVIVAIDGVAVKTDSVLRDIIAKARPGSVVALELVRQGTTKSQVVRVKLGDLDNQASAQPHKLKLRRR